MSDDTMSAFECYKEYLALKNHFTKPSYNYFKYNGKIKVDFSSFDKRKDKLFFQKLAKHPDVHNFLIANLSDNSKLWIRELAYSEHAEKTYRDWAKKQQSLTYVFKQNLNKLNLDFNSNFLCKNNEHPILLKLYLGDEISLETLCILLELSGAKTHWDSKMQYDLVWDDLKTKLEKYIPFIKYDKDKIKNIVLDFFAE
jgi:hypothetical protein